jgi:hypothetical protein
MTKVLQVNEIDPTDLQGDDSPEFIFGDDINFK